MTPSLRCLPFAAVLCAAACHAPPAVPVVVGSDAFTVGYRGEVAPLGATMPVPDPVVVPASSTKARLVTVRTTILELEADVAVQFVPALLTTGEPPAAATEAPAPAQAPAASDRLQPRHRETAVPRTMRGVHVDPLTIRKSVAELCDKGLARRVDEPEVSCAEGQEASVSCLDQTAVVTRVDLVPNGSSQFAFDLGIDTVQHGTWLQLAPRRGSDGGLTLGIRLQLRELLQPVPIAATRFGSLHLPAIAVQDLRAFENVKNRDALVLGTLSGGRQGMVVLAIVEISADADGKGTWILP
jgi:hypothetical protein